MLTNVFLLLQTAAVVLAYDQFGGNYTLPPCRESLCLKPCANLNKDLAYIRVWIDKWPFTLADKEISAGIVVEPRIELSDLVCSIQAVATYDFGKNVTYDYQFHWCKEHYTVPPHVNCPAHKPQMYGHTFAVEQIFDYFLLPIKEGRAIAKFISSTGNVLACIDVLLRHPKEQI
ncbi:uncharacterized protein [Oscarella lobularis]|uniref:uncharacterized protein n=1 Tax=Oscarella lobularis TaxID=121494 RepID=UPI0033134B90